MNNKMAINPYISTIETKIQNKQQRQNHGYGELFDGCQMGGACGGVGEDVRGLISTSR